MKRYALITLACLLALPAAAEEVDKTIDAAPDGHVHVSNIAGSVTVNGWSRNTVEVTGTLGRNVKELVFERHDNKTIIKVKVPRRSGRGTDSDLNINIPMNSSLDVGTVSADIDVTDVTGDQSLQTVSGDVTAEFAGAEMDVESVSGDLDISGDNEDNEVGEIDASTVSGDVTLFRVAGEVAAESVSGDVEVDEGSFMRIDIGTVTGEIVFQGTLLEDGRLSAETVNGDIDVELDGKISARFEVETFNGSIRNCFGHEAERTSKYAPGWELEFTVGDGDGRVEVSTLNGGVNICRN